MTLKLMMALNATRVAIYMAILLMRTVNLLKMALEKGLKCKTATSSWLLALNPFTVGMTLRRHLTIGPLVGAAAQVFLRAS